MMWTLSLLLNTALPMLEASPLCQKPPSPITAMARLSAFALNAAAAIAHRGVADVERRQNREEVAADVAAHVMLAEFTLYQFHRRENRPLRTAGTERWRAAVHVRRDRSGG